MSELRLVVQLGNLFGLVRGGCGILATLYQCSLSSQDVVIPSVGLVGHLLLLLGVELPLLGRHRFRAFAGRLSLLLFEGFLVLLVGDGLLRKDLLFAPLELSLLL